jgi:hypothetical protein
MLRAVSRQKNNPKPQKCATRIRLTELCHKTRRASGTPRESVRIFSFRRQNQEPGVAYEWRQSLKPDDSYPRPCPAKPSPFSAPLRPSPPRLLSAPNGMTLPRCRRGTGHEDRIAPQAPTIQTSRKPPLTPPHKQRRASPVTVSAHRPKPDSSSAARHPSVVRRGGLAASGLDERGEEIE